MEVADLGIDNSGRELDSLAATLKRDETCSR